MIEWHVLDPSQELVSSNGAAILGIARELASAATDVGITSRIVGGNRGYVDLPEALPILGGPKTHRGFRRFIERSYRFVTGSSLQATLNFSQEYGPTPKLIVLHNLPWAGAEMRKRFGDARIVLYVHNRLLNGLPAWSIRRVLRNFDEIICVSDSTRLDLERRSQFSESGAPKFRTIHNALRTERSFPNSVPKYDVVYVGRLVKEKGVHILAEAAALPGPRWRVAVVGGKYFSPGAEEDPYVLGLHRYAEEHGLDINFSGPVPPSAVLDYLSRARVAVVTSIWEEPGGLTLLESMASPAAVVSSRVGGLPEMSSAGGVIFVNPGDPRALRQAVDELLENETMRLLVAEKGCEEVADRTWDKVYRRLTTYS